MSAPGPRPGPGANTTSSSPTSQRSAPLAATGLGNLAIDKAVGPPNDPSEPAADLTEASLDIQYLASAGLGNENWGCGTRAAVWRAVARTRRSQWGGSWSCVEKIIKCA